MKAATHTGNTRGTWLCTYLWLVRFETNFWQMLQNPALVPCVVLDGGPRGDPARKKEDLFSRLLFSFELTTAAARIWPSVSAFGFNWLCERLLRRFFLAELAKLSSKNSRLTEMQKWTLSNFWCSKKVEVAKTEAEVAKFEVKGGKIGSWGGQNWKLNGQNWSWDGQIWSWSGQNWNWSDQN